MWSKADTLGEKNFRQSAREKLTSPSEQVAQRTGSIRIWKKSKEEAKLFFNRGNLIAVEVSTLALNVQNFVLASEQLANHQNYYDQVFERVSTQPDESDVDFLKFLGARQLFPDAPLNEYLRERFIDFLLEVLTWEDVNAEWRMNDQPSSPTIPPLNIDETFAYVQRLEEHFAHTTLKDWGIDPRHLGEVLYTTGTTDIADIPMPERKSYLLLSNASRGAADVIGQAEGFGIPVWRAKHILHSYWHEGAVDVIIAGTTYTNRTPEESVVHVEPRADEFYEEPGETVAAEVEVVDADEPPAIPQPEETFTEIDTETYTAPIDEEPASEEPTLEGETMTDPTPVPQQPTEPAPERALFPAPAPAPTTGPTDLGRLSSLIEQVRQEVSNLDSQIAQQEVQLQEKRDRVQEIVNVANNVREKHDEATKQIAFFTEQRHNAEQELTRHNAEYETHKHEVAALETALQAAKSQKAEISNLLR